MHGHNCHPILIITKYLAILISMLGNSEQDQGIQIPFCLKMGKTKLPLPCTKPPTEFFHWIESNHMSHCQGEGVTGSLNTGPPLTGQCGCLMVTLQLRLEVAAMFMHLSDLLHLKNLPSVGTRSFFSYTFSSVTKV